MAGVRLLAAALIACGDVDIGASLLREGLVEARRLGLRRLEMLLLNTLSVVAARKDALELLELQLQCLEISREVGDRSIEVHVLGNIGIAWTRLGDLRKAREHLEQAIRMSQACGQKLGEGRALCNLSEVAQHEGEYASALSLARCAHEIFVASGARSWQAFAMLKLGEAQLALGNCGEARHAFEQAYIGTFKMHDPMQYDAAAGLARTALAQRDIVRAVSDVDVVLLHVAGGGTLDGTEDARLIEWTLYRVLDEVHDARASDWLARAHDAILAQAARLVDISPARGFANNIPHYREILAAWSRLHDSGGERPLSAA